jgi:hypothetical protein
MGRKHNIIYKKREEIEYSVTFIGISISNNSIMDNFVYTIMYTYLILI